MNSEKTMEWTFRQFYIAYPHLISAVKDALIESNLKGIQIGQSLTDQLQSADYKMKFNSSADD